MKTSILCVDDEQSNLDALERCLRKSYHVIQATSGHQALEALQSQTIPIIISDQRMPGMTGVDFFTESMKTHPHSIRILQTGYTDLESVIEAINRGEIYRYITKPWNPNELLATVQQAVEIYDMRIKIQSQNIELKLANQELAQLEKFKSDFMILVNHELKTPLTAISSYVQLLGEEHLESHQHLYLKKISKNCSRLDNLIHDTLLITQIKSTQQTIESQSLDLVALIDGVLLENQNIIDQKTLTIKQDSSESVQIQSHPTFLAIAIKKLIHNSLFHAPNNSEVAIKIKRSSDQDWMLNLSNSLQSKIERPAKELLGAFHRTENIKNHSGGTGLGLTVADTIINLLNGTLNIEFDDEKFKASLVFVNKDHLNS